MTERVIVYDSGEAMTHHEAALAWVIADALAALNPDPLAENPDGPSRLDWVHETAHRELQRGDHGVRVCPEGLR